MTIFHRGQTEGFVLAGVFFISDAYEGSLQQPNNCRQHFLPRQTRQFQVLSNSPANIWQRFGELSESPELVFVAYLAPAFVVPVLLATPRIATGGLDVTIRQGTNPDFSPRGRHGQTFNPKQPLLVANWFSFQ